MVFLSSLYKPFHDRIKEGGLIFLGAFLILFFTRYGIWEQSRDLLKYRYLMEILAVPAILSRFVLRKKALRRKKMILHALFLEVAILFVLTVLYLEIPLIWLPTALGALAVVLALPFFVSEDSRRILLYSLLIEWAALISLILISAKSGMAGGIYVSGTITIALSTGYIIYLIRSGKIREEIITPLSLRYAKISTLAREKLNAVLLYPLAVATALFIYITFDARILTLLWALECFLVFSASIFLREEHFRFVSQAGLLLCVARLLLVDMTGSSLLIRGNRVSGSGNTYAKRQSSL